MPLPSQTGNHCIVCGDGPLAYRIGEELTSRYGEDVVLVLPERLRSNGPQMSTPAGATVLERDDLSSETFIEAGVASARAVALVGQDDLANFHAALRAQELNPDLRLVVAAFNRRLGEHIRGFFRDCTVLSSSSMAAPSFVAAALGSPAPSHVRVSGRTLYLAKRSDVPPGHVVCGLAVPDDPAGTTQLVAPDELAGGDDGLVLAVADGTPRDPLAMRRHPGRAFAGMLWRLAWNKFGLVFAILLVVVAIGFGLLLTRYSAGTALYLTVMDMTGSAFTGPSIRGAERAAQLLLTIEGMALIPLGPRRTTAARRSCHRRRPR